MRGRGLEEVSVTSSVGFSKVSAARRSETPAPNGRTMGRCFGDGVNYGFRKVSAPEVRYSGSYNFLNHFGNGWITVFIEHTGVSTLNHLVIND